MSFLQYVSTTHKYQTNKETSCTLQTVALLLRHGADPNFPLGRSMGSAMCAITTHSAHKHRELGASLTLVRQDLVHFAFARHLSAMYAINSDGNDYMYIVINTITYSIGSLEQALP